MRTIIIGSLLLLLGISATIATPNDFEVQTAVNVPTIGKHDIFSSGTKIIVPEGGTLTLIDRTGKSLRTRICAGKYEGPIEKCPMPQTESGRTTTAGGTRGQNK